MTITPDQARALLANQSERGALWNADWNFTDRTAAIVREDSPGDEVMEIRFNGDDTAFSDGDLALAAAAPELAQTIAVMRTEWGVEQATGTTQWFRSRPMAEAHAQVHGCFRLVRRLVGPTEPIDKETPND